MNTPWEPVEQAFRDLFEREWYTNHGPLGKAFELALEQLLGTDHAVCVVNPAIALTMALEALPLQGAVALFGTNTPHIHSASYWSNTALVNGTRPEPPAAVLCNGTHANDFEQARQLAALEQIPLILSCTETNPTAFMQLCESGLPAQCDLFVLSFEHGQAIEAQGAACIATCNAILAETLRNIRSSYGTRATVAVTKTANGRMSEAQAAFGLINIGRLNQAEDTQ